MEKVNPSVALYAKFITFLAVWFASMVVSGLIAPVDFLGALKLIPTAITVYAIIAVIFTRWIWCWPIFQGWLIKIPDLRGTWRGELKSDWIDPKTGLPILPITVILVIRQTFSNINVTLMTKESTSYSTTASINLAANSEDLYLTYNYTNRPKATLWDRSAIHDGAAILKIVRRPDRRLQGEYWTARKTRGDIDVRFVSRERTESFS